MFMRDDIIEWDNRYAVGIEQIDEQHRALLKMVNNLCFDNRMDEDPSKIFFQMTVHDVMRFLQYHFLSEEELLERIKYPDIAAHKQQHSNFVKEVFDKLDQPGKNQQPVPQNITHRLRNMIITHITLIDKKYATYIHLLNHGAEMQGRDDGLPTELFLV
jgi:hemerythrin